MQSQLSLVHCIIFPSNRHPYSCNCNISCWQLYWKPFSRTSFLTKHFNKKMTITQIVVIIIIANNSKRRKTNKFNRSFDQFEKYILCQICNKLAKYFWGIGSKGGSFVKYRLWHQNYFGMDYPPIFRSTPPHYALPIHYYLNFFNLLPPPPIILYFKTSAPTHL